MDYKTGRSSNCKKEWWNKIPLYSHIQTHAQMGIQTEEGTKKSTHVNTASKEEKERFKKEPERYYWILFKRRRIHCSIYRWIILFLWFTCKKSMDKEGWKTGCKNHWIPSGVSIIGCHKSGRKTTVQTVWLVWCKHIFRLPKTNS